MDVRIVTLAVALLVGCNGAGELSRSGMKLAIAAVDGAQHAQPPVTIEGLEVKPVLKDTPAGYQRMRPIARSGSFGNAVLLIDSENEVIVPIYIGGTEALSIQLRIQGRKFTRPLTHDLFDRFAARMGAKMVRAQVDSLDDSVYIGTVIFEKDGDLITFDARPSDAIALAIGNSVPILVSKKLVDKAGVRTDQLDEQHANPPANPVEL